jgi:Tfp pilus assembly protein PilF
MPMRMCLAGTVAHTACPIGLNPLRFGAARDRAASERSLVESGSLYLRERASFAQTRATLERALAIGERTLDSNHPDVATWLTNLAGVLQVQCDLVRAKELLERALAIQRQRGDEDRAYSLLHAIVSIEIELGDPAAAAARLRRRWRSTSRVRPATR